MTHHKKRQYKRLEVDLPVVVTTSEGRQVRRAENLSLGGMQIALAGESVKEGTIIELEFRVPGSWIPIQCQAEVVHRTENKLGVRFSTTNLFALAAVAMHVTDRLRN